MKKNILVIDDEVNIAQTLADLLELKGYEVQTANNGLAGFTRAIKETPDLILCDIMMPKMDGYEVLEAIREHEKLKQIPFIFLTAKGTPDDFRSGMDLGADDYMLKPIDARHLYNVIENRLGRYEHLVEVGQMEENNRITAELHDTLQQTILGIKMNISYILEHSPDHPMTSKLKESLETANLALSQLRMIIEDADIMYQDTNFITAISNVVSKVSSYVPFEIQLHVNFDHEIDKEVSQVLLRTIFEILNNTIKHSEAKKLEISFSSTDDGIQLTTTDDGCGFDINHSNKGHGLKSMRKKIEEIGGQLEIISSTGKGTTILISINQQSQ